jgi:hypothetical protein
LALLLFSFRLLVHLQNFCSECFATKAQSCTKFSLYFLAPLCLRGEIFSFIFHTSIQYFLISNDKKIQSPIGESVAFFLDSEEHNSQKGTNCVQNGSGFDPAHYILNIKQQWNIFCVYVFGFS